MRVIEPDIVFFGQNLPERFFSMLNKDIPQENAMLVIEEMGWLEEYRALKAESEEKLAEMQRQGS